MAEITRNGKAYDSVDCEAFINGVPVEITTATYGNEQEHQLNWTLGHDPWTTPIEVEFRQKNTGLYPWIYDA